MIIKIENKRFKAELSTKGGELQNLVDKKNGKEFVCSQNIEME